MFQIIINLPESLRLELCIHACACDLTLPQLLAHCATDMVASGRPNGWEDLTEGEEGEAVQAAGITTINA